MRIDRQKPIYVVVYSAVVSAAFTGAIMAVQVAATPRVARNEKMFRYKALVEILHLGDVAHMTGDQIVQRVERRVVGVLPADRRTVTDGRTGRSFRVYRARDESGRTTGWAFPVSGIGFWDRIEGLVALDAGMDRITGVRFLRHAETPGLGGRIGTDRAWLKRFEGLAASPPPAGDRLIYVGGDPPTDRADPRHGRWIDGLSGATGTSTAVQRILNRDLGAFRRAAAAAGLLPGGRPGSDGGKG